MPWSVSQGPALLHGIYSSGSTAAGPAVYLSFRKDTEDDLGGDLWDGFGHVHRMEQEVDVFEIESETDIGNRTMGSDNVVLGICVTVM